jgi:hypothetical protein
MSSELDIQKPVKALNKFATVITTFFVIGSLYVLYRNNIWRPHVTIQSVDWDKGIAMITIGKKQKVLYGDVTLAAGFDWGVRFDKAPDQSSAGYSRIDIVKGEKVYEVVSKRGQNKTV